ncbi:uncharacterized mitochondrial protein AtMg00860-like [Vicia villosa]|uniref:uncharacterized mitochondrial protein AtMg00860-like n=1 Tax=Vicia villosa TaxID=3911 RepID=UPI00273AE8E1|nr:uncharacterized mitochondrial protein AtMg00860-like [Vicia villosa]
MVTEGIILGHKVSSRGLEVDQAKVEVIEKLPPSLNMKGIRSFLGHADFYQRFIKDFSKVAKPLSNLLNKDKSFIFDDACMLAFNDLKEKLSNAPIIIAPIWSFCNAQLDRVLEQFGVKHKVPTHKRTVKSRDKKKYGKNSFKL